jgi:hypothetical protein
LISASIGSQLEAQILHDSDVLDVLARDLRNRDIEDFEVLSADQVQQQIERTFECFEDDLERIRWDVQVLRNLQHRRPAHHRQRHLALQRGRCDGAGWRKRGASVGRRLHGFVDQGLASHLGAGPLRAGAKALSCLATRLVPRGSHL